MYIQGVDSVYDLAFNDEGVTYGDVFKQNEVQFSEYNFEVANTDTLFRWFKDAAEECRACVDAKLPLPRSEEHPSELQTLMRTSYAVFCLKQKTPQYTTHTLPSSCCTL